MTGFIDIHTHILPGVDDGAQTEEKALELLTMAYQNGTRAVFLTPHHRGKYRKNAPEKLREVYLNLRRSAAEALPNMKLYLAQEIFYDNESVHALAEGNALGIDESGYAMLEFSPKSTREQILKGVSDFLYYGYTPVIAHVERYDTIRRSDALLKELLAKGALLQLNADSVLGKYGPGIKNFCHRLLRREEASFIASDAHDTHQRPPSLRECFLYVHKKYGGDYAHRLFYDNPIALVEKWEI